MSHFQVIALQKSNNFSKLLILAGIFEFAAIFEGL